MRKELPIGISNYREAKEEKRYYIVDKSKMIEDFLKSGTKVTLITRPRRFGKTLNMSMMAEFFDVTKDSKDIFEGTYILESEYVSYMNHYPTIFLSFANIKGNKQSIMKGLKLMLLEIYEKYDYIFTKLNYYESIVYDDVMSCLREIKQTSLSGYENSLVFLMD